MPISFTRRGRYRLTRDGVEISRHNVELEAVESGFGHAEENGAGTYRIIPPEYIEFTVPIMNILAGTRPGGVQSGGGGGGSGSYAATHFVAPYASVSGAANDYADLGATAWTNAASSGTPTTLGTAMARAVAGNKVQCAPGVYVGQVNTGSQWNSSFRPTNSGGFGNEIVFFAQYPAATNVGSTSLYSEINRPLTVSTGGAVGACIGVDAQDYVVLDGFYCDESACRAGPSAGLIQLHDAQYCHIRRCLVDRTDVTDYNTWSGASGYNGNAFFAFASHHSTLSDCYVFGNGGMTNQNDSAFELYCSEYFTVQYSTWLNCGPAIFIKAEKAVDLPNITTNTAVKYNKAHSYDCIQIKDSRSVEVSYNECVATNRAFFWNNPDFSEAGQKCLLTCHHNTLIASMSSASAGCIYIRGNAMQIATTAEIRDNICVGYNSGNGYLYLAESAWAADDLNDIARFNYNVYHDRDGSPRWDDPGFAVQTTMAGYQSAQAALWDADSYGREIEQDSQYSDPDFVNFASGDYKLNSNGQAALTASSTGGVVGCYVTGAEEIGVRASPTY